MRPSSHRYRQDGLNIARTDNDAHISIISYWKKADASDQSGANPYEWDINDQTQAEGGITAYSGVDSTDPINSVASSTGSLFYCDRTISPQPVLPMKRS